MTDPKRIPKRLQHDGFGKELRGVMASGREGNETAGIIIEELDALWTAKQAGRPHPKEDRLQGDDLDAVGYLRLYKGGQSIRIYFTMLGGDMWMLALDTSKRKGSLDDGMKKKLRDRRRDVESRALAAPAATRQRTRRE